MKIVLIVRSKSSDSVSARKTLSVAATSLWSIRAYMLDAESQHQMKSYFAPTCTCHTSIIRIMVPHCPRLQSASTTTNRYYCGLQNKATRPSNRCVVRELTVRASMATQTAAWPDAMVMRPDAPAAPAKVAAWNPPEAANHVNLRICPSLALLHSDINSPAVYRDLNPICHEHLSPFSTRDGQAWLALFDFGPEPNTIGVPQGCDASTRIASWSP